MVITFLNLIAVPSGETSNNKLAGVKRKGPPIRRLSEDARPLSNLEMDMYRNKRVLHTPAPPPSTSNIQSATMKHSDYQRKLLQFHMRTHTGKRPYIPSTTRVETQSRSASRGVPMTPAIAPTTISLTHLETPQPRSTNPFTHLSTEARHLYSRSMSQPANLLRNQSTGRGILSSAQMSTEQRIRIQRLASRLANDSSSSSTELPSTLLPPNE